MDPATPGHLASENAVYGHSGAIFPVTASLLFL